jgi:aminoglycoside phosphotransferase (APT) family kinase protein
MGMHDDEIGHSVGVVRRLLGDQRPAWAELEIEAVTSTGTDNSMYRLGPDMVVRLPLRPAATEAIDKEHRWLPVLAAQLPVEIPVPLVKGSPTSYFPWAWSIYPWIDGTDGTTMEIDRTALIEDLAQFINRLWSLDPTGGPVPSAADLGRGVPLQDRDHFTRKWIGLGSHLVDADELTASWERSLSAAPWANQGCWIHGDIASGNLIFRQGRLIGVIDFATLAVGDPACDLIVAWEMFTKTSREHFRREVAVDEETWERGRGWALSTAIAALGYYETSNPYMFSQAQRKLALVLDHG